MGDRNAERKWGEIKTTKESKKFQAAKRKSELLKLLRKNKAKCKRGAHKQDKKYLTFAQQVEHVQELQQVVQGDVQDDIQNFNMPATPTITPTTPDMMSQIFLPVEQTATKRGAENAENAEEVEEVEEAEKVEKPEKPVKPEKLTVKTVKSLQEKHIHRMEIWFADLGHHPGLCIQNGQRPVLIISNDINNEVAPIVTVAPMTSKLRKLYLPTHILVEPSDISQIDSQSDTCEVETDVNGVLLSLLSSVSSALRPGVVLLEQITVIDKKQLKNCIGKITATGKLNILNNSIAAFLGL